MKKIHTDTAIIGGGIIGLSCAFEEKQKGKSVFLIDRNKIGKNNASWAASGTIISRDPKKFFSSLRELCVESIQMIPSWLRSIAIHSGIEIPLTKGGCYYFFDMNSKNGRHEHKIMFSQINRELATNYQELGIPEFLKEHTAGNYKTVYFPNEYYVNNRMLLTSLKKACINMGVETIEKPIQKITEEDHIKIEFENVHIYAKHLVIAAGAWSSEILKFFNLQLNIIPVKGQMVTLPKFYSSDAMMFFHRDLYIVPRKDTILVGSTQEKGIWDETFDTFGYDHIEGHFKRYLPHVPFNPIQKWAGIRSILKDRYPIMGYVNQKKSISLCTGHYKIGIAVAPLTAKCMSQFIAGQKTDFDMSTFDPWREKALQHCKNPNTIV